VGHLYDARDRWKKSTSPHASILFLDRRERGGGVRVGVFEMTNEVALGHHTFN
jgi:hypothetical protein